MNTILLPTVENIYKCLSDQQYVPFILDPTKSFEYRICKRGMDVPFKFLAMSSFSPDPISFIIGLVIKFQDAGRRITKLEFKGIGHIQLMMFDEKGDVVFLEFHIGRHSIERKTPQQIVSEFL